MGISDNYSHFTPNTTATVAREKGRSEDGRASGWRALIVLLVNSMGGYLMGYNTGMIAGALPMLAVPLELTPFTSGIFTVSVLLGATIGSAIGGQLADVLGRRWSVFVTGIVTAVAALASSISPTEFYVLCGIRIVLGLGCGLACVVCTVYATEMAPKERVGVFALSFQFACTVGILISYLVAIPLSHIDAELGWRILFGLGSLPGFALVVLMFFMLESVEWVKKHPEGVHAKRAWWWCCCCCGGGSEYSQMAEMEDYDEYADETGLRAGGGDASASLFQHPMSLFLGLVFAITLQFTGINAFMYFSPIIFSKVGSFSTMGGDDGPLYIASVVGAWNVLFTVVAAFLVNRFARRTLFLANVVLMVIANFGMGAVMQFGGHLGITETYIGYLSVLFLLLFIAAFEMGPGSLFWLVVPEVYHPSVRQGGVSLVNMLQWAFNLILSASFLSVSEYVGAGVVFLGFAVVGVLCFCVLAVLWDGGAGESSQEESQYAASLANRRSRGDDFYASQAEIPSDGGLSRGAMNVMRAHGLGKQRFPDELSIDDLDVRDLDFDDVVADRMLRA